MNQSATLTFESVTLPALVERGTRISAYLKNTGTLERAAAMANHSSTRTRQLYDHRPDEVTLDEVERVLI